MEPRLIQGLQAEYRPASFEDSDPAFIPLGKHVLVKMDECASTSSGGVHLPIDMKDKMTEAAVTGVLVRVGPEAFRLFDDGTRWTAETPQPGVRVCIQKYAGELVRGRDGALYRAMDYRCIIGQLENDMTTLLAPDALVAA